MRKIDFWTSVIFNFITVVLFVEHLCGLSLALEFMIGWTIISLIVHISILKDYIVIRVKEA